MSRSEYAGHPQTWRRPSVAWLLALSAAGLAACGTPTSVAQPSGSGAPTSAAAPSTDTGPTGTSSPSSLSIPSTTTTAPAATGPAGYLLTSAPIPYPQRRKDQMAAYSQRHYGVSSWRLEPQVIVLHFTETDTAAPAYNTFASNAPNLGELPGTCAHFLVDQRGVVQQLVPTEVMCRHTIGLNHVAIGIEIVQATHGHSSAWACQQILNRPAQREAVLALVRDLQSRYRIATTDVVGHAMANGHRLFLDRQGWRNDHGDWPTAEVMALRARL